MGLRTGLNEWLSILLKVAFIVVICLAGMWLVISLYANVTENNNTLGLPDYPSIEKAGYTVYIEATGNVLLTDKYEHPSDNLYILEGYWEVKDGKYRYYRQTLQLDTLYFGGIIITRRVR